MSNDSPAQSQRHQQRMQRKKEVADVVIAWANQV